MSIFNPEHLGAACSEVLADLESIVCTEGCDSGIIMISDESPTHKDDEGRSVYDYEHFSPLGDALVALHRKLAAIVEHVLRKETPVTTKPESVPTVQAKYYEHCSGRIELRTTAPEQPLDWRQVNVNVVPHDGQAKSEPANPQGLRTNKRKEAP